VHIAFNRSDDASEYFDTFSNFFVYGGNGLKSDFGGHSNSHHHNVYAFISGSCLGVNSFKAGFEDQWNRNQCIMLRDAAFGSFDCSTPPLMSNNSIFIPPGGQSVNVCGKSPMQLGVSSISEWPKAATIIAWGRNVLQMN